MSKLTFIRQEVIDLLREGEIVVNFTKANGESRSMQCTLSSDLVPTPLVIDGDWDRDHPTATLVKTRKQNPDVVNVWDTQKADWRSFRLDSIQSIVVLY